MPRGIRAATTAAAVTVVAVVLALVGVGVLALLRHQVHASMEQVAQQRADAVAQEVERSGFSVDLTGVPGEESLVQVLRGEQVVVSSPAIEGEAPLVARRPSGGHAETWVTSDLPAEEENGFAVAVQPVRWGGASGYIIAAQSLESVDRSMVITGWLLLGSYPVILLLVGGATFWGTGRALRPVERIRRQVASIASTADSSGRVPVPDAADEVARLATTMNLMLTRLDDALTSQRRFVADASHELRTPLATIRATHEVNLSHPKIADWDVDGPHVLEELDRLDRIVADMLLTAKSDEGTLGLRTARVDLAELLAEEGRRAARVAPRLAIRTDLTPLVVTADADLLLRAVRNLVDNAVRHATSQVRLSTAVAAQTPGSIAIHASDDGAGVPPNERERIFERFVRLDESRARDQGGAGLGLAIARQIARAHGGDLIVTDAAGGGACFVLTFPSSTD